MNTFFKILLALVILFSIGFYFQRYNYMTLDGDLPAIVLPVKSYEPILKDPFGLNVLLFDSVYSATNRFFVHFAMRSYFRHVPLWLQKVFHPIDSIYIAAAIVRTFTQFFIIFMIAGYVAGMKRFWDLHFLFAAALCIPLFQNYKYYTWMAVIDSSVTYTFFYALSLSLVLLFFLPFLNAYLGRRSYNFSPLLQLALACLLVVICLSGPLNAPVVVLACSASLLNFFTSNFKMQPNVPVFRRMLESFLAIPLSVRRLFSLAILLCLYSVYIGTHNLENFWTPVPLADRYAKLWTGFWYQYTFKLAQPLLIGILLVNVFIVYKLKPDQEASKVLRLLKWFGIVAVVYILLLPFGGYRVYRENIIRFDTVMPITIGLMAFYAYTTVYIFKSLRTRIKLALYCVLITGINTIYINTDWGLFKFNQCERMAFNEIARSPERIVLLESGCSVLNWEKMKNPGESKSKAAMLLYWNIIKEQKLYYQK